MVERRSPSCFFASGPLHRAQPPHNPGGVSLVKTRDEQRFGASVRRSACLWVISLLIQRPTTEQGTRRNTLRSHAIKRGLCGCLSEGARKNTGVAYFATPVFKWSEPDPFRNSNRDTFFLKRLITRDSAGHFQLLSWLSKISISNDLSLLGVFSPDDQLR